MGQLSKCLAVGAFALLMTSGETPRAAQVTPAPAPGQATAAAPQDPQQPTFRLTIDLVTTDLFIRDSRTNQFISDIKVEELEVYEDGVRQEIASLTLVNGGRVFNVQAPPPPPSPEGIILPPVRPNTDASGRVFVLFIDDLHLDFQSTPRTRMLLQNMLRNLIHEGDMFGIVTTGTSSISQQLTYDRQVLESAVSRITGGAMRPQEIITGPAGSQGPDELRYRAHVAFSTAYELVNNLANLRNRRKAVLYVSSGYDFNPFEQSRLEEVARKMFAPGELEEEGRSIDEIRFDPFIKGTLDSQRLAESDLIRELDELTRAANRANATFYTIDPRGLVAGPGIDSEIPVQEWNEFVRDSQLSLRILADETGGIAVVNRNDFDRALKQIDAETSDYYVLGYYSSNPDPLRRTRRLEVRTTRPGVNVWSRTSYSLPPLPAPQ